VIRRFFRFEDGKLMSKKERGVYHFIRLGSVRYGLAASRFRRAVECHGIMTGNRIPKGLELGGTTWILLVGLVLCAAYFASELYFLDGEIGLPLDDSWIHLQFARNLAGGDGLSYNPGEKSTGSTAPLWTAFIALFFYLPGSPVFWVKFLGVALYLAGIQASMVLARELGLRRASIYLVGVLNAATSWLVWSALSGMEVPLFVLLSSWGVVFHIRERRSESELSFSLPLLGLSILARPEGVMLLGLALIDRLVLFRRNEEGDLVGKRNAVRPILLGLVGAGMLVLPTALFNLAISGSVLPTTYAAKAGGGSDWLPNLQRLFEMLSIFLRCQPYMVFAAFAGAVVLIRRLGTRRDSGLLSALWLFGLPLAYSTLSDSQGYVVVGNFGRYLFPLFPFLIVLGVLGLEQAGIALGGRVVVGKLGVPLRAVLVALILWPTATAVYAGLRLYLQTVANVQDSDVRMARWLEGRLAPEAVLAVNDVGALKYFLPNRIVDLAGIINPEVRDYLDETRLGGEDWHWGLLRFLGETRPDYLVVFPGWYPRLSQLEPRIRPQYVLEIPANITMGGNELVVYSTPWTRFALKLDSE
jgi:hypothetical protein